MRRFSLVLFPLLSSACAFGQVRDFVSFAKELIDPDALTRVDFIATKMDSSYDRTGGNQDGFLKERYSSDGVYTITELEGPGVIRRFYAGTTGGVLRIYIDGDPKPVIEMPCTEFFSGGTAPFLRPVVGPMGGSNHAYFPIPYAKSIKIQTSRRTDPEPARPGDVFSARTGGVGIYYQVTYQTFPKGTPVRSLRLPLTGDEQAVWKRVVETWSNPGRDLRPAGLARLTVDQDIRVAPGQTASLANLTGAGAIDAVQLKVDPPDAALLRSTLLRMRWDDEKTDAVDCPLGDFFGNAFSRVLYKSLLMGLTEEGFYTYFSMPFASSGQISIVNQSATQTLTVRSKVVWHKTQGMAENVGHFHAKWRREEVVAVNTGGKNTTGEYNYPVLDVRGQGRYVGMNFNVFNRQLRWWGEGDPMIFVDDEVWPPSLHGTGTEEYFNDGWNFHEYIMAVGADPKAREPNFAAISGVLDPGIESPRNCYGGNAVFVFHLADSMPFQKHLRVTFEHGSANDFTNDYSSTAFWYARPGGMDFFVMRPPEERGVIPTDQWPSMRQQAVERQAAQGAAAR